MDREPVSRAEEVRDKLRLLILAGEDINISRPCDYWKRNSHKGPPIWHLRGRVGKMKDEDITCWSFFSDSECLGWLKATFDA